MSSLLVIDWLLDDRRRLEHLHRSRRLSEGTRPFQNPSRRSFESVRRHTFWCRRDEKKIKLKGGASHGMRRNDKDERHGIHYPFYSQKQRTTTRNDHRLDLFLMMEAQITQAMTRLRQIEIQVKDIENKIAMHLPRQYSHLTAVVCGWKWYMQTKINLKNVQQDAVERGVKKLRMELGAFDYQAKTQAELLTRYLCELDDILSMGNMEVKETRKALVVYIQKLLQDADAFKTRTEHLKLFGERMIDRVAATTTIPSAIQSERSEEMAQPGDEEAQSVSDAESEDMHMRTLFPDSEEEMEVAETEEVDESESEDEEMDAHEVDEEEQSDSEVSEQEEDEKEDEALCHTSQQQRAHDAIDISSLPVWQPYYQVQRRPDGVYLVAKLHDVERDNIQVRYADEISTLGISGFKLPTQKDLIITRFSGTPTFGRFDIRVQLPRNMVDMERAVQRLHEDGTLEIRMPYYQVQYPRYYCEPSFFRPRRLSVW